MSATVYPLGLRLEGRRVLVAGGGTVAQRRMPGLLSGGAEVVLVSPVITPMLEGFVHSGQVRWEQRPYQAGDLDGAWLVIAATDSPEVNAEIVAAADAQRIWCVRTDAADGSPAWTPAVGRHDGVTVAVLGGGDPRRAAAVRDGAVEALANGSLDSPRFRDAGQPGALPGVALVGAGPGDPDLITVRGRRLLARADVVVADRLVPHQLLGELPSHVEVIDASKIPYGRFMAQEAINAALVEHALAGKFVVRLKGGDSFVFGRGGEELAACTAAGIPVEVVPGVTSAIAVPARAGIPVTHRGVTHEFVVVSGHVAPGDPQSLVDWPSIARLRGTIVVLMGVERLRQIAAALIEYGRDAGTPAAVIQEGTTASQRSVTATLGTIADTMAEAGLSHPAIIVIGDVVAIAAQLRGAAPA